MKLTILGTGTPASQIPNIKNRFPPGYLLDTGDEKILFDCSEGIRFRIEKAGYKFTDIHHIAITHVHLDHFQLPSLVLSMFCAGNWGGEINRAISVYAPKQVIDSYKIIMKCQVPDQKNNTFKFPKIKFLKAPSKGRRIGKSILSSMEVYHGYGKTESVGFRVEKNKKIFAYSGDTGDCKNIRKIAKDADLFVCDAAALIGDLKTSKTYGHLTPFLVGQICKEANVKKVVITHYTGLDSNKDVIRDCRKSRYKGEIVCGKDFEVYNI